MKDAAQMISLIIGVPLLLYSGYHGIMEPSRRSADAQIIIQQQPVVDAANEGKIIAINGQLKMLKPARTGPIIADSVILVEKAHRFTRKSNDSKSPDYNRFEYRYNNTERFYGTAQLGDFMIDKSVLEEVPESYMTNKGTIITGLNNLYMTNSDGRRTSVAKNPYFTERRTVREGDYGYKYLAYDMNKYPSITFVGIQEGNTLKKANVHETFYDHAIDKKDIEESGWSYTTLLILGVIGAGLTGFGWYKHEW